MNGINAKFYRNTGSYGTPTWTEVSIIADVNISMPWDLVDASTRASKAKLYAPTQKDIAVTVRARVDLSDAGFIAMNEAAGDGSAIDCLILNGTKGTIGHTGVRAHFHFSDTGEDQAIGAVLFKTFDLKPGLSSDGVPKLAEVTGADTLTFTAI